MVLALVAVTFTPLRATAATGTTIRASVASDGAQAQGRSGHSALTPDGGYVAFASGAGNLVASDTNDAWDVFVRDNRTETVTRVSVATDGTQAEPDPRAHPGTLYSAGPAISADGRFVAFTSTANNLVGGDTNENADVFVHDRQNGVTTRVSVDSNGIQAVFGAIDAAISADGRHVAFSSSSVNLVVGDTNAAQDIFVHDRLTATTTRVSVDSNGTQAIGHSQDQAISDDGRFVAFRTPSSNLVVGDTNGADDVFVHDRATGATTRVSVKSDGTEGNSNSLPPDLSADGRYVLFASEASNLVEGDTNSKNDVFVHDRRTATTARVSVTGAGQQAKGWSDLGSISADGRYVVFASTASNLVLGDTNGRRDLFTRDRHAGTVTRVNVASDGSQVTTGFLGQSHDISADGRYVAFDDSALGLVARDTNGTFDVFIRDTEGQPLLSIGDATVTEGDSGTRAVFAVTLSKPSSSWVYVNYATAKGSATGTDFTAKSGTLSFAPGTSGLNVKVAITPDTLAENTETFSVKLSAPTGATIADGIGVGTIIDND